MIVNYTPSTSRHLEISSHDTVNRCPGSYRDTLRRSNQQRVYLAGCESGTAHVFLKSTSGRTLNNYGVTVLPVPPTPTPSPTPGPTPTATATPRPTATATPTPATCEKGREDTIFLYAGDWLAFDTPWGSGCVTFVLRTLANWAHVVLTLESGDGDPVLTLYRGEGVGGTVEATNDNTQEGSGDGSLLGRTISRGIYTVKAQAKSTPPTGGRVRLQVQTQRAVLLSGQSPDDVNHQGDRSAEYVPLNPGDLPFSWADTIVQDEAAKWNRAANGIVELCERGTCGGSSDGRVMPVRVLAGSKQSQDTATFDGWTDSTGRQIIDCGSTTACVLYNYDRNNHITRVEMRIENPAWQYDALGTATPVQWTNRRTLHNKVIDGKLVRYLPATVLHELGHSFGLDDLRWIGSPFTGYLMHEADKHTSVPLTDQAYLFQVYRHHMADGH